MLKAILLMLVLILPVTTIAYADKDDDDDGKYDRLKETCSNYGDGKWEDGECKISDIEEEGAYEDYICDHPRPGIPYEEVCHNATLAFASEDDNELTERDVDVLCDASEDYEAHKEQCDKLYDNVKEDYSETEEWNERDYEESKQDDDKDEKYQVKSKEGDSEVTRYYDDKDDAEEAYENLDRDELPHSDKSFSDWEYDDEEHPSLR